MKLPIFANLKARVLGYEPHLAPLRPGYRVDVKEGPADQETFLNRVLVSCQIGVHCNTAPGDPKARQRAAEILARQIYGPVHDELIEALHELWRDGLHEHPAARRIEAMLPTLRGEQEE